MANRHRYAVKEMLLAIRGEPESSFPMLRESSEGKIKIIAERLDCTEQTVRNYMAPNTNKAKRIRAAVKHELTMYRAGLYEIAEDGLKAKVEDKDWNAIKFVLSTLGKDVYSTRHEMTGADGAVLFPEDVVKLLEEMGMEPSEAVQEFAKMLRLAALESVDDDSG